VALTLHLHKTGGYSYSNRNACGKAEVTDTDA